MQEITILILAFILVAWNHDTDYIYPKKLFLNLIFVGFISWNVAQYSWTMAALCFYALVSSCYLSTWTRIDHFCNPLGKRNHVFLYGVSTTFIDYLVLIGLFLMIPKEMVGKFFDIVPILAIVGAIMTIVPRMQMCERRGYKIKCYGLAGNSSVNSTLMSLLAISSLASSIQYLNYIGFILGVIGTFKSFGSAGVGGVLLGSAVYFSYINPVLVVSTILLVALTAPIWWKASKKLFGEGEPVLKIRGFEIKLHPIFRMSNRDRLWKFAIKSVWLRAPEVFPKMKWLGIGNGSFMFAMPALQMQDKEEVFKESQQVCMWLHNDLLQWLIEGGIMGFAIFLAFFVELLIVGHHDPFFMSFAACFLVNATANFPMRIAPDSFLLVVSLKRLLS